MPSSAFAIARRRRATRLSLSTLTNLRSTVEVRSFLIPSSFFFLQGSVVKVTPEDRRRLEAIVADRSAPQKHVWRAKIVLATADGYGTTEIMRRSGKSKPVVWRWQERFMQRGCRRAACATKRASPARRRFRRQTVQRVIDLALGPPPGETTHWTGRMLAQAAGVAPAFRAAHPRSPPTRAASHPYLQTVEGPEVRREAQRCRRPLRRSARPCGGALGR